MSERTVEIRNDGEGDGRVLGAAVEAPFGVMTRVSSLPVRARTSFIASFTPVRPGPITGDLVITTNDPDTPRVHVRLRANGVATAMPPVVVEDAGYVDDVVDASVPSSSGAQDGSCGCRAQGTTGGNGTFAWWVVAGVMLGARRRSRAQGAMTSKRIL